MIKAGLAEIAAIEQGIKPDYKVIVYWQVPEAYTESDLLISVGDITTSMSGGSSYEAANTVVELSNEDYYFSRKLEKELPNNKLIEIYIHNSILIYRGIVSSWKLTETTLRLNTT